MTIGELIEGYCKSSGITNQRFAELCGKSKGYISQLINGRNPKTGKPITPTIETYIKIAKTMNMTLDEMFSVLDDVPIALKKNLDISMNGSIEETPSNSRSNGMSPQTDEARSVSGWMDHQPESLRKFLQNMVLAVILNSPEHVDIPDMHNERKD